MAEYRSVDFLIKEAQRLADLTSVLHDLETVSTHCDLFLRRKLSEIADIGEMYAHAALGITALMSYGRTIESRVREGISLDILSKAGAKEGSDLWKIHQHSKNLRDKWIAHSVNPFENYRVRAHLAPEELGARNITSISVHGHRVTSTSGREMAELRQLAIALIKVVAQEIEEEKQKLLAIARSRPMEDFYEAKDDPPAPITNSMAWADKEALYGRLMFCRGPVRVFL